VREEAVDHGGQGGELGETHGEAGPPVPMTIPIPLATLEEDNAVLDMLVRRTSLNGLLAVADKTTD
jgi:hypothetical protein